MATSAPDILPAGWPGPRPKAASEDIPAYLEGIEPDDVVVNKLEYVLTIADEMVECERVVADLEKRLEAGKARLRDIKHHKLPDAMDEAGIDHVGLPEKGVNIRLKAWFEGSLPKVDKPKERQAAIDWISSKGYGDLLTTTVSIHFGRSEHNLAHQVKENVSDWLAEQGLSNIVGMKEDIHHQTYKAFLREQTKQGTVLPLNVLNATVGRVAEIVQREEV